MFIKKEKKVEISSLSPKWAEQGGGVRAKGISPLKRVHYAIPKIPFNLKLKNRIIFFNPT